MRRSSLKNGWFGCAVLLLVAACGGGGDGSAQLTYSPNAPPPPTGTTGVAYTAFTFAAPTGGVGPFTWSETGALPQGMSLSASGQLSGTPQAAGTFPITLTVTDSSSPHQVVTESVSLDIKDSPLVIKTAPQPPAGAQYSPYAGFAFTAHGGSVPFTWSVTGGALPPGLRLNSDGTLSGTPTGPTGAGSTFTVTVTDSSPNPETNSHAFTIVINQPKVTITSRSPPSGTANERYDRHTVASCNPVIPFFCFCQPTPLGGLVCTEYGFQLTANYGVQPYSWKWAATTSVGLPPGLGLAADGLIEGSPTMAGSYGIVVTVTDSSQPATEATASYTITINPSPPPPPPQIYTVSTLAVAVNVAFNFVFFATGQPPLTWSETGALPGGFSLSPGGVLSGTPVVLGSFPITLEVKDSAGQNAMPQNLTIVVTQHGFDMTGSMNTPRSLHTATLLQDGTVLIVGGNDNGTAVASSELYSPASGTFSPSGALVTARYFHTATLLGTGHVLVAGGDDLHGNAMASAELYDPNSKTFTALSSMVSARDSHTSTLLGNGKVLLAGGSTANGTTGAQPTAELFDPSTGSFSGTGSMSTARAGHTATLLDTGKVLIAGGINVGGGAVATAELYDPSTGTFTLTGAMNTARYRHTATLLSNGSVLLTGGTDSVGNSIMSAEVYDPKSGSFTTTGHMGTPRTFHTASLLSDGTVLVVGGVDQNGDPLVGAELYAPGTGQFALTGGLQSPRYEHAAIVLASGNVLVTGGGAAAIGPLSTAEVYQ